MQVMSLINNGYMIQYKVIHFDEENEFLREEELNQLGKEGWELIAIHDGYYHFAQHNYQPVELKAQVRGNDLAFILNRSKGVERLE